MLGSSTRWSAARSLAVLADTPPTPVRMDHNPGLAKPGEEARFARVLRAELLQLLFELLVAASSFAKGPQVKQDGHRPVVVAGLLRVDQAVHTPPCRLLVLGESIETLLASGGRLLLAASVFVSPPFRDSPLPVQAQAFRGVSQLSRGTSSLSSTSARTAFTVLT